MHRGSRHFLPSFKTGINTNINPNVVLVGPVVEDSPELVDVGVLDGLLGERVVNSKCHALRYLYWPFLSAIFYITFGRS